MIAGVDIGGTKIAVGMVEEHGRVLSRLDSPTNASSGFARAIERIAEMLRETARSAGAEISGIGIGCTGPVDPFSGTIGEVDFLPGWQGQNPVCELERIFGVPVAMENDADAAALGEVGWGEGKGKRSLLYITVGTGIGGGIILDGHLYRGVGQAHPEIGHHVIDSSGPLCSCGAHGCWEVLARGPAMVEWVKNAAAADYPHREGLTAKRICELSGQGDELSCRAVEREAHYLGLGLANLVTLFAPEAIVLGGGVMESASLFWNGMQSVIRRNCGLVPFEKTALARSSLGTDAAIIGAARVWHHRFPEGRD